VEEEQPISEQDLEANADKPEGQEAAKEAGEQEYVDKQEQDDYYWAE
jgi:hypothetical protein